MKNNNFENIIEVILKSQLSPEEQDNLIVLFSNASDEELSLVSGLLSNDNNLINLINKNYNLKKEILNSKGRDFLRELIKEEENNL